MRAALAGCLSKMPYIRIIEMPGMLTGWSQKECYPQQSIFVIKFVFAVAFVPFLSVISMMANKSEELCQDLKLVGVPCAAQVRLPPIARVPRPSTISVPRPSAATESDRSPSVARAPKPSAVRCGSKPRPYQECAHQTALQYRRGNQNLCWNKHQLHPYRFNEHGYYCIICLLDIRCGSRGLACHDCSHHLCSGCSPASKRPLDLVDAWKMLIANADEGLMKSQYLVGRVYEFGVHHYDIVNDDHRRALRHAIKRYALRALHYC
jgi:hypothetical protein